MKIKLQSTPHILALGIIWEEKTGKLIVSFFPGISLVIKIKTFLSFLGEVKEISLKEVGGGDLETWLGYPCWRAYYEQRMTAREAMEECLRVRRCVPWKGGDKNS